MITDNQMLNMNRRQLCGGICAGAAILVAGCTGTNGGQDPSSETDTESEPTPPSGDVQRRVTLAEQDSAPDQTAIELTAEVTQPWITTEKTALVRISTTNRGSERALSVGESRCAIFNRNQKGSDKPAGLWLHRQPEETPTRVEDKWVADKPAGEARGQALYYCPPRTYESGETVSTTYQVWHDYREDGYLDPGEYRWEQGIKVWDDPEADGSPDPGEKFSWGFTLRVSEG